MPTPVESRDFVQGFANVDRTGVLLAETTFLNGGQTASLDCSTWQSLLVFAGPVVGITGGLNALSMSYGVGAATVEQETITFPSHIDENNDPGGVLWRIPVGGDNVVFQIATNEPSGVNLQVVGSTRPVLGRAISQVVERGRLLLVVPSFTIPANSNSATHYLPPTDNGYRIFYNIAGTANVTLRMQGVYLTPPAIAAEYSLIADASNGVDTSTELPIGNTAHTVFFNNGTAGGVVGSVRIWEREP